MDGSEDISSEVTVIEPRARVTGTYSDILIGRFRNQEVAIKVLKHINQKSLPSMRRKIRREREVWAALLHPNIVPFYGYAEDEAIFGLFGALISPWYCHGDAGQFLEEHGETMDISWRSSMGRGVILGVWYLHTYSPSIVHGDLKPGNILIDNELNPRICDFGLARILLEEGKSGLTTTSEHSGTERYLAYELVVSDDDTSVPTFSSDVYALACIGLEFLYLQQPYAHRKTNGRGHIFQDIRNGIPPAYRPTSGSEHFARIWDTFDACWKLNPEERIDAEVVAHQHEIWHKSLESEDTALQRHIIPDTGMDIDGYSILTSPVVSASTPASAIRPSFISISPSPNSWLTEQPPIQQNSVPNSQLHLWDQAHTQVQGEGNYKEASDILETTLRSFPSNNPLQPSFSFSESHLHSPSPSNGPYGHNFTYFQPPVVPPQYPHGPVTGNLEAPKPFSMRQTQEPQSEVPSYSEVEKLKETMKLYIPWEKPMSEEIRYSYDLNTSRGTCWIPLNSGESHMVSGAWGNAEKAKESAARAARLWIESRLKSQPPPTPYIS